MDQPKILRSFFNKDFENKQDDILKKQSSEFNKNEVLEYITKICSIPYKEFILYVKENPNNMVIRSSDLTQSSKLEACTTKLCDAFNRGSDKGLELKEVGLLLHNDEKERSDNTLGRYGLDQTKTGRQLGLTRCCNGKWYLTCIGKVFLLLDKNKQDSLLARIILRDPLYSRLIKDAQNKDIHICDYMMDIGEETIKRRKSSIRNIVKIALSECSLEKIVLHNITY